MDKKYYVYILSSSRKGTLYVGMTDDIMRRLLEHRNGLLDGFTKKYCVKHFVHCETYDNPQDAIQRERQLKRWRRQWKINLIESENPAWKDLD